MEKFFLSWIFTPKYMYMYLCSLYSYCFYLSYVGKCRKRRKKIFLSVTYDLLCLMRAILFLSLGTFLSVTWAICCCLKLNPLLCSLFLFLLHNEVHTHTHTHIHIHIHMVNLLTISFVTQTKWLVATWRVFFLPFLLLLFLFFLLLFKSEHIFLPFPLKVILITSGIYLGLRNDLETHVNLLLTLLILTYF